MLSKQIILSLMLFCSFTAEAVVIVIHGSFAADRGWWSTSGEFFKAVEKEAARLGERVVPFCWSGHPSAKLIDVAGHNLAWLILSYPRNEHITVIAHSNGGNVVNAASRALFDPIEKMCGQLSSRPIKDILDMAYAKLDDKPIATTASLVVPMPGQLHNGFDYSYTTRQSASLKQAVDDCIARGVFKKRHIIDRAIYLGTPADLEHFPPHMDVIGTLINLYSDGDNIQQAMGMYGRRYPLVPRLANIQAQVKVNGSLATLDPGHSQLHSSLIGQWLLHIPEVLMSLDGTRNGFNAFEFNKNGTIIFAESAEPRYVPCILKGAKPISVAIEAPIVDSVVLTEPAIDMPMDETPEIAIAPAIAEFMEELEAEKVTSAVAA